LIDHNKYTEVPVAKSHQFHLSTALLASRCSLVRFAMPVK